MNIAVRRIGLSDNILDFSGRKDYDILLCMATYDFPECTIRMLRSIDKLNAKCLAVVSGCKLGGLKEIAKHEYPCDVVLMKAPHNSIYLCRDWGFVWAVHEGIRADFLFIVDDDLEFIDISAEMLPILNEVKIDPGFSVMGFKPSKPKLAGAEKIGPNYRINPAFIDGNLNITQWDDNLNYGLPDSLPNEPMSYFTEIEYQHKMRVLTGRSTLIRVDKVYYTHHFRSDPIRAKARAVSCGRGIWAGGELWEKKYGLTDLRIAVEQKDAYRIFEFVKNKPDMMKRHLLFGGLWNDWPAIYHKFEDQFERVI